MHDLKISGSPRGNTYIAVSYHQPTAGTRGKSNEKPKSKWSIKPQEQFDIFCRADKIDCPEKDKCQNIKSCPNADECPKKRDRRWMSGRYLFSFKNNAKDIIGLGNERFARFEGDDSLKEWHGYPVRQPEISLDLIDYWRDNDLISDATKRDLRRRTI